MSDESLMYVRSVPFVAKDPGDGGGFTPKTGSITSDESGKAKVDFVTPDSQISLSRVLVSKLIYSQWKRTVLPAIVLVKRVPLYLVFYSSPTANTSTVGLMLAMLYPECTPGNGTLAVNNFRLSSANGG